MYAPQLTRRKGYTPLYDLITHVYQLRSRDGVIRRHNGPVHASAIISQTLNFISK